MKAFNCPIIGTSQCKMSTEKVNNTIKFDNQTHI